MARDEAGKKSGRAGSRKIQGERLGIPISASAVAFGDNLETMRDWKNGLTFSDEQCALPKESIGWFQQSTRLSPIDP